MDIGYQYDTISTNNKANLSRTKLSYKTWLWPNTTYLLNKINISTYFENLTVELHILYAFSTHVKFCVN